MDRCEHKNMWSDVREHDEARYVPTGWRDDDAEIETVTLRDTFYYCLDCGELLDVDYGD